MSEKSLGHGFNSGVNCCSGSSVVSLAFKQNLIGMVHSCIQIQAQTSVTYFTLILLNIKLETCITFVIQFQCLLSNSGNYILGIIMVRLGSIQEKVARYMNRKVS